MHVIKTNFNGNVNIGLYVYVTEGYCLAGPDVPDEQVKKMQKAFDVPVHKITIAGTGLIGVFLAGNSNSLLVPKIAFDAELKKLDNLNIKYSIIDTDLTALGNNVLCNDKGALVNPEFTDKAIKQIEKALKVNVKKSKIAGLGTVGSLAAFNDKGCLVHRDAEDFELDLVEQTLGVEVTIGTVNFGSPYIRSGVAVNSKGFIIGDISGGPEIQNADIALGFANG